MGACCDKSEDQNEENNDDYKVIGGEIYQQSQNDNNFLRLHNYEELKKLLNELLTKIKPVYWHEYEQYLLEHIEEIGRYKQYVQQVQGSIRQQLFLEIIDAKFLLSDQILQNYSDIKVEILINRQNRDKTLKFSTQPQNIFLLSESDLQKRSDVQKNKQKKWVYWNQFKNFNLGEENDDSQETQETKSLQQKEQTKSENNLEIKNSQNSENKENGQSNENTENKENGQSNENTENKGNSENNDENQNEQKNQSEQDLGIEVPNQPKVSVITGKRVIDFSNGVQKHSFQIKMVGFNKKKKKTFQIGETEEFMLFELLDQQVHFREIKIRKKQSGKTQFMANLYIKIQLLHDEQKFVDFWNTELNAREKQINKILNYIQNNQRERQKTIEIRDKNESLMVEELNSFISRKNTIIFYTKSKTNTQSSNQSVNHDSSLNSYYNIGFYMK